LYRRSLLALTVACFPIATSTAQQTVAAAPLQSSAEEHIDDLLARHITIDVRHVSRTHAIDIAAKLAKVPVQYWTPAFDAYHDSVTVQLANVPLRTVLQQILAGTTLRVVPDGSSQLAIVEGPEHDRVVQQDSGVLQGHVTDSATGHGLQGVTVTVQGTTVSTVTNNQGAYLLKDIPIGMRIVTIRLVGYKSAMRKIMITNEHLQTMSVVLSPTATMLSGVVTTATGTQRKITVGNDITRINVDSVLQLAPVTNVTQLLQDRVPGLVVQNTSGNPGAPSRLRLRGVSSISSNNDPIVIVDGVRIYADQSGSGTEGNISQVPGAISDAGGGSSVGGYAGPSALDQIDPNSIATIEVMKGPSASALYGSDAANGVIVITTKHGHVGPARWNASADLGRSALQGSWPINYFRFGSPQGGGVSTICSPYAGSACVLDSIRTFQALNDPAFSPLDVGGRQDLNLAVSGGNGTLQYAFSGTAGNQTGYLRLPNAIATNFATTHGFAAPDWMVHPQRYATWGGMGRLDVQLGHSGAAVSFSENLFHSSQQQSSLQTSLASLQAVYLTPENLATATFINQYYERALLNTTTITNAMTLSNWSPWPWLPITATLGLNTANLENSSLLPRNYVIGSTDSVGHYRVSRGTNQDETLNIGTSIPYRFAHVTVGINVHTSSTSTLAASTGASGIPLGVSTPTSFGAGAGGGLTTQSVYNTATYGWYLQPTFQLGSRLFINPGMRFDGGSASGAGNTMDVFPKTDISYLAVNRPDDPLFGVLTLVRPRIAFGISGVQPGPAEALRTFITDQSVTPFDTTGMVETSQSVISIFGLGNPDLHPERSRELEGGVDVGFGNDRVTLTLTGYNKTRYDAIESIPVAPSVAGYVGAGIGANIAKNIGTIRNTGLEATVGARLFDTQTLGWSVNANWATDRNRVVSLLAGQSPIRDAHVAGYGHYETRVTPGYPLFGIWANPIASYTDVNDDGIIEPAEMRFSDSAAYLGAPYPDYTLALSTTVTLLNRRLSINTAASYASGLTQINSGANLIQLVVNDPTSTPGAQAAVAAAYDMSNSGSSSAFGRIQTVNTLRWTSVSINYILAPRIAKIFRASSMSVALQGSNLGLHTNYRGKDPNVNAFATGNSIEDSGQLPQPRTWSLRVSLGD
jgi:TonB-dependent SusC/RagA subfamily outer membrane receptor